MTSDIPEASGMCKEALATLAERPALFSACLGEVTKTRRAALLRMFINSLTKGSGGKAIELSSHDPVRYCGDLLAWLHQNIATERDFLVNLLPTSGDIATALTTVNPDTITDTVATLSNYNHRFETGGGYQINRVATGYLKWRLI
eukprot:sb/3473957/